jgi:hypothetical protein
MSKPAESALIVLVPEAEERVRVLRERFDPSARLGVPAHITVLYPFMPPRLIDAAVLAALERLFTALPQFAFALPRVARFPDVAYLAPEPASAFVRLAETLVKNFPDYPPYGGRFGTIVPHLTVAHDAEVEVATVQGKLAEDMAAIGPIQSHCRQITLIENSSGMWRNMRAFPLGTERTRNERA